MQFERKISEYKGYLIMEIGLKFYTDYYAIFKDGQRESILSLSSEKACKNVIDTHERSIAEQAKSNIR